MEKLGELGFSKSKATIMHIDFNSCFASIEQQANPFLRGKPVVVVPYASKSSGCVLTASREARVYGIKTAMNLREAKKLCPFVIPVQSDPDKYRQVHLKLRKILSNYSDYLKPKSIDEFVLDFSDRWVEINQREIGLEIKKRVKEEIGEWLTVSIGFGPNWFLAKTAAGLIKPDGLETIDIRNYGGVYKNLELVDLNGINHRLALRLRVVGIKNVSEMYEASVLKLKSAFLSVAAHYWYLRLRGYEVDRVDWARKSFGNTYSLPQALIEKEDLVKVILKLSEKASFRLRKKGMVARGVTLSVSYRNGGWWRGTRSNKDNPLGKTEALKKLEELMGEAPRGEVRNLAVTYHTLSEMEKGRLFLWEEFGREERAVRAVDKIKARWGEWAIGPAVLKGIEDAAPDAVAFGGVRDLGL